jgi:hypothetical protein
MRMKVAHLLRKCPVEYLAAMFSLSPPPPKVGPTYGGGACATRVTRGEQCRR